jgi:hypothetical protein
MLGEIENPRLRALIVWEPVLPSDLFPPTSSVLSRLDDSRAEQFWDGGRSLSDAMVRDPENAWLAEDGEPVSPDLILWDEVLVFPPGRTWDAHGPPTARCGPVVGCLQDIRSAVSAQVE